jgi:hypothetical protein
MAFDANDLTPHEHFVMERTRNGEVADFTSMAGPGAKPAVRAGFLRKLMLGLDHNWSVRAPGVRLKGARIEGALDLTDCTGAGGASLPALSLEACDLPDPVDLSHARLARLTLTHCRLRRIRAAEASVEGELCLARASALGAPGAETLDADLRGARIGGDLRLSGTHFARAAEGGDAVVLRIDGADIAGDVLMDDGFEALGAASLANARIGGTLCCDGAHLLNRTDDAKGAALIARGADIGADARLRAKAEGALDFSGARIGGDLDITQALLRNEFGAALALANARIGGQMLGAAKIAGQVSLQGAEIGRNLDLRGAEFANPLTPRADSFGVVIDAANLSVGGAALLQGANLKGEVFLADARISGYLAFGGGRFINGGHWAVRAPNVRVGGNLTFKIAENGFAPHGQKTVIEGGAKFDRARIEGALAWLNLELRGPGPDGAKGAVLSFADARIDGPVRARALVAQQTARIDLSGAACSALDDDVKAGWGVETAPLELDGFAYGRIDSEDERWPRRLGWLKRSRREGERISPQPFAHAAQVYARAGKREDARRILLAQHDLRTLSASSGPLTWALSSLFGLIAGYGLAPIRVVRALALYLALGVGGVLAMNAQGALVTPDGRACNGAVEPALYAVDVALPVLDLGQEGRCGPGRTARADLPAGMTVGESEWRLFEGAALWKWAHALYAMLGAILTALAVVTFSGVLKPKDD